jgi:hypothetical protein
VLFIFSVVVTVFVIILFVDIVQVIAEGKLLRRIKVILAVIIAAVVVLLIPAHQ